MLKYVVITSEYPGDALVLVGEYDTFEEAQEAAENRLATNREGTAVYITEVPYFARSELTPETLPTE